MLALEICSVDGTIAGLVSLPAEEDARMSRREFEGPLSVRVESDSLSERCPIHRWPTDVPKLSKTGSASLRH